MTAQQVYFLTDTRTQSYVGYTTCVALRYRTHRLKLAHAAKATKRFAACRLEAYIDGFPTKNLALSFEWHAKRRRAAATCLGQHKRLDSYLATVTLEKFRGLTLTIYLRERAWVEPVRNAYPWCNVCVYQNHQNV